MEPYLFYVNIVLHGVDKHFITKAHAHFRRSFEYSWILQTFLQIINNTYENKTRKTSLVEY